VLGVLKKFWKNGNSQWRKRKKSVVGEKRTGGMRKGRDEKSDM